MAIKEQRGYQAKRRNTGERKRRSILFLSVEGSNKTEKSYFIDFSRAQGRQVRFAPGNYTDPVHLVNALKKECGEQGYDEEYGDMAFCLVDADVKPEKNHQLEKADKVAHKSKISLLVSNPCFEVWFLCHYGCNSKHYGSNEEVINELRKRLPNYKKSGESLFATLCQKTEEAIKNARMLEQRCLDVGYKTHTTEFCPSTEVYKVVEVLLQSA